MRHERAASSVRVVRVPPIPGTAQAMTALNVGFVESNPDLITVEVQDDPELDLFPVQVALSGLHLSLSVSAMESLREQLDDLRRCASCEINLATVKEGDDWLCVRCVPADEYDEFERLRDH